MSTDRPVIYPGTLFHLLTIHSVQHYLKRDDLTSSTRTNYEILLRSLQKSYDECPEEDEGGEFLKD